MSDARFSLHRQFVGIVRVLGLFFIIEGLSGFASNGIDLWGQTRRAREIGEEFWAWQALGWSVGSGLCFVAGCLLLFKTTAVIRLFIFPGESSHGDRGGSTPDLG